MTSDQNPIIHAYTREHAFEDGTLVNLSTTPEWKEAGFVTPVACTRAVWNQFIEWTDEDSKRQTYQDQPGRLWDVLFMLSLAIRTRGNGNVLHYELHVVPRGGRGRMARRTVLKALCGPGDYAEPVITIMLPNED